MITLGRGGSRASDYITLAPKPKPPATPKQPAAPKPPAVSPVMRTASARTPVAATDSTGATIDGAYIENGQTYFGNGTRIGEGTTVIDDSGREWVKGPGSGGGTLTGNNFGIDWEDEYNTGGGTGGTANDYYDNLLTEQQKAAQARIDAALDANNAYIQQVNQRSDQSLQNAYILREQSKVNAPQALSAMGIQGGAAESSLLGINTGYENTRNEVEQNRQNSLNEIYQNEQQIRATGDATKAEAAASYYQNLITAQQQAEAAQQAQSNWEAGYELDVKKYEDAAAAAQWQRDYEEKIYNDRLLADKQKVSAVGGTVTPIAPTKDQNISGNYNVVLNNVKRGLGGSNAGSSKSWDAVINYIQNSVKQNMITEYEARQMISQLGLE
jgi:hypothetical protein